MSVITIDGPASSGKGTLSRKLANVLGYTHIDNGSVFRAIALNLIKGNIELSTANPNEIVKIIKNTKLELIWDGSRCIINLDGMDVSSEISGLEVGKHTSQLASNREYFIALSEATRNLAQEGNFISDGRAVGTFIFPTADIKFFISASPEVRAQRRFLDLTAQGKEVTYEEVLLDILDRDERDKNREFCPLIPSEDAIMIDTTNALPEESLAEMIKSIKDRIGENYLPPIK